MVEVVAPLTSSLWTTVFCTQSRSLALFPDTTFVLCSSSLKAKHVEDLSSRQKSRLVPMWQASPPISPSSTADCVGIERQVRKR